MKFRAAKTETLLFVLNNTEVKIMKRHINHATISSNGKMQLNSSVNIKLKTEKNLITLGPYKAIDINKLEYEREAHGWIGGNCSPHAGTGIFVYTD